MKIHSLSPASLSPHVPPERDRNLSEIRVNCWAKDLVGLGIERPISVPSKGLFLFPLKVISVPSKGLFLCPVKGYCYFQYRVISVPSK